MDTGLIRTATTESAGEYTITNLPPKLYNITIEAQGFEKYTHQIKVGVGSVNDVSAKLAVTGASTTVEVTGSAETAVVNTENQTLSQTINSKQMVDLPTLTRNPYDLVATAGNVTEDKNSIVALVIPSTAHVPPIPTSCWMAAKTLICLLPQWARVFRLIRFRNSAF